MAPCHAGASTCRIVGVLAYWLDFLLAWPHPPRPRPPPPSFRPGYSPSCREALPSRPRPAPSCPTSSSCSTPGLTLAFLCLAGGLLYEPRAPRHARKQRSRRVLYQRGHWKAFSKSEPTHDYGGNWNAARDEITDAPIASFTCTRNGCND